MYQLAAKQKMLFDWLNLLVSYTKIFLLHVNEYNHQVLAVDAIWLVCSYSLITFSANNVYRIIVTTSTYDKNNYILISNINNEHTLSSHKETLAAKHERLDPIQSYRQISLSKKQRITVDIWHLIVIEQMNLQ